MMRLVQDILNFPSVIQYHYKEGNLHWELIVKFVLLHVLSVVAITRIPYCKPETFLWSYFLWWFSGLGITAGAHRLWAHRSYEASVPIRVVLMLANSVANQGTLFHWCRDHIVHHKFSETDADPHNATRGFFFAHIGWLLLKKNAAVKKAGNELDLTYLQEDPVVMFQHKLEPWLPAYLCFFMPAQVASHFWGESFLNGWLIACLLRYFVVLQFTMLVNSAAHLMGDHPYDTSSYPAENPIVSLVAGGEGWHSWHHKYPYDYATSEFGILTQFNPTKMFIDLFAAFGMVWGRKRGTVAWGMARARRDRDRANGVPIAKCPPRPWEIQTTTMKVE